MKTTIKRKKPYNLSNVLMYPILSHSSMVESSQV